MIGDRSFSDSHLYLVVILLVVGEGISGSTASANGQARSSTNSTTSNELVGKEKGMDAEISGPNSDSGDSQNRFQRFEYPAGSSKDRMASSGPSTRNDSLEVTTATIRSGPLSRYFKSAGDSSNTKDSGPSDTRKRKTPTPNDTSDVFKQPRLSSTSSPSAPGPVNNLRDSLGPGLILISIGLNPGIQTGQTGHAYAHPTNRYWPTLFESGIIPIRHKPADTHSLVDLYGLGHTNIIAHKASRDGSTLSKSDYDQGAADLEVKIRSFKPQAVMMVGKGVWLEWCRYKLGRKWNDKQDGKFQYGWQDKLPNLWVGREKKADGWKGARTFVATTTSAASTAHSKEERLEIWQPMGEWFAPKREEWVRKREDGTGETKNELDDSS